MSDVTLSKAVRSNLLSLQNTASMMSQTQNRLATGNKVNSALDNPTNFFTASSLNARAGDINALMDDMANGIQTIEAADNGLTAITKTLESMQSTLRQARQDKSFETISLSMPSSDSDPSGGEVLQLSDGAFGEGVSATPIALTKTQTEDVSATNAKATGSSALGTLDLSSETDDQEFTISDGTNTATITFAAGDSYSNEDILDAIRTELTAENVNVEADIDAQGRLTLTSTGTPGDADEFTVGGDTTGLGITAGTYDGTDATSSSKEVWKDVNEIVNSINNDSSLNTKIRASNDNGQLRIENLSTQALNIDGASESGVIDGQSTGAASVAGNSVRADLAQQYNELRDQLDKLADDASFNGVNLLRGDELTITFNETGTSELVIQAKNGEAINAGNLDLPTNMEAHNFDSDRDIDGFLGKVKSAINEVRSQASAFGSSLSIVENRQNFSKNMINTLETGAGNLTLADANEEAANLLALQTRQQLSSTALSMASQADQAVLRLF